MQPFYELDFEVMKEIRRNCLKLLFIQILELKITIKKHKKLIKGDKGEKMGCNFRFTYFHGGNQPH
jgi:hypothetical protein